MAKLQSPTEPPSDAERIAALQARNAELELELQELEERLRKQEEATSEQALSLLRTTLEATADGILAINAQGSITHFNRKFVELWQVPDSIIASRDDWQLSPFMQEQLKDSEGFLSQVRAEYAQPELESQGLVEFKDGKIFERYSKPQVLGEEIIGRVVSYRDITARTQAEAALGQSEERFRVVLKNSPITVFYQDTELRYTWVYNPPSGTDVEAIVGKCDEDLFPYEDDAQKLTAIKSRVLTTGVGTREEVFLSVNGEIQCFDLTVEPLRNRVGEIVGITCAATNITERKKAEDALGQSEECFSKAFRSNPIASAISTLSEGRIIDINESFLKLFGYSREELIDRTGTELRLWADEGEGHRVRQLEQQQNLHNLGVRYRTKSGEIRDGIASFEVIDLSGELCLLTQMYDVTEHKRIETELQESQQLLQGVLDAAPVGIYLKNLQGQYILLNPYCLSMMGWSREQVLGKTDRDLFPAEIANGIQARDRAALEAREAVTHEVVIPNIDGLCTYISKKFPVWDAAGNPYAICGISTDISARKRMEESLRQSEERYRAVVEDQTELICRFLSDGTLTFVNNAYCRYFNASSEELVGCNFLDMLPVAERSGVSQLIEELRCLTPENPLRTQEHQVVKLNGDIRWVEWTNRAIFAADGQLVEFQAVGRDITDRKRMEESLRQSEERFSKAFRTNPAATAITSLTEGRYIDVNDEFLNLLGFKREEVIGKTSVELGLWVDTTDRPQLLQQIIHHLQQQPIRDLELQFRKKSGEIRDGITSVELIDMSGELCMLSQLRDVTDSKRTQSALKYRLDFEALLTSISTQFINLKATEVDRAINQALQQIGEFAQVDRACIFLISDDGQRFLNTHQWHDAEVMPLVYPPEGMALDGLSWTVQQLREFKIIHAPSVPDLPEPRKSISQSFGVQSYIAVPIAYEGCLIGSLAFNSIRTAKTWSAEDATLLRALADIFASALMRKRSEEALRESEERFRQLAENIDSVFWMMSADERRTLYISPAYERIWGRSPQQLYDFQDWLDSIHPEDYERVVECLEQQVQDEHPQVMYRIVRPDGEIRWICDRSFPVYDSNGRIYRVAGIADDITSRKQAEDALRESEAKLNGILNSAIALISRFRVFANQDWEYEFLSSACEAVYGYTSQELIANKRLWQSRVLPEDWEAVILPLFEEIFGERTSTFEYRLYHKDGSLRWILASLTSQRDDAADCWMVTIVETDISDRKRVEEQLRISLQEKEALLKEVHHRVKNNLQVISSLLDLQSQRIQEPQTLEAFRESQTRVRSMALIHEKLYQSESLSKVNLAEYIQILATYLIQTYAINPDRITLQLNLEPVALNLDTAIPCGLILNELISNALKHAFPGNTGGTIWINLCCLRQGVPGEGSDAFELVVGDDGVKFPELPDFSRAKSLGFQLVSILIGQLNGQIEVSQSQGKEFKLRVHSA